MNIERIMAVSALMRINVGFATAVLAAFIGFGAGTALRAAETARVELGSIVSASGKPWIDTTYCATPTTRFVLDMQKTSTVNQERFFGAHLSSANWGFSMYQNGSGNWAYTYCSGSMGWNQITTAGIKVDTARHLIDFNYKTATGRALKIDNGATVNDWPLSPGMAITTPYPIAIGASRIGPALTDVSQDQICTHRLYSAKVYEVDELVRDFVPCAVGSVTGLWDRVSETFYAPPQGAYQGENPATNRLYVVSDYSDSVSALPSFGMHDDVAVGSTVNASVDPCAVSDTVIANCTGWRFSTNGVTCNSGVGNSVSYTHQAGFDKLEWFFETASNKVAFIVCGVGGTVSTPGGFFATNATATATATASESFRFGYWTGDLPAGVDATQATLTVPADRPRSLSAIFFSTLPVITNYVNQASSTPAYPYLTWETAAKTLADAVLAIQQGSSTGVVFFAGEQVISSRLSSPMPFRLSAPIPRPTSSRSTS